jgi:DNA-binding response OmpR family regulator
MPANLLHVLHVDDQPEILALVEQCLTGEATVKGADSLAAAKSMLAQASYDIILLDLGLPDSQGTSTVEALRCYGIPIVVLSGMDSPEMLSAAAEAGADDFIPKSSVTPTRLVNRLRFAHARYMRRMGEAKERKGGKKRSFTGSTFEALKPFISCADVAGPAGRRLLGCR